MRTRVSSQEPVCPISTSYHLTITIRYGNGPRFKVAFCSRWIQWVPSVVTWSSLSHSCVAGFVNHHPRHVVDGPVWLSRGQHIVLAMAFMIYMRLLNEAWFWICFTLFNNTKWYIMEHHSGTEHFILRIKRRCLYVVLSYDPFIVSFDLLWIVNCCCIIVESLICG